MPKLPRSPAAPGCGAACWRTARTPCAWKTPLRPAAWGPCTATPHTQITYIVSGRYRFTIGDETREVGPGDTLLKQNGVMHGCVCLEGGVMLDFFTPMREDFV